VAWQPLDSLSIGLALGYMDGEYEDFISEGRDFSGLDLVNAPELSVTTRAAYEWRTGIGAFTLSGDVAYKSETDLDFRDDLNSTVAFDRARARFVADAHTLLGARAAWRNLAGNIELAVWARNITNEEVLTHTTLGTNEAVLFYDAPRSLGFNASFTF
jgi:outer membrane receptor protein involved in Fe transport